jgi:hypothetical protein
LPKLHALGHRITEDTLAPLTEGERETLVSLMRKMG